VKWSRGQFNFNHGWTRINTDFFDANFTNWCELLKKERHVLLVASKRGKDGNHEKHEAHKICAAKKRNQTRHLVPTVPLRIFWR
jgi:hypothetical protein